MSENPTVVIALPGDSFSGQFLRNFTMTIMELSKRYKIVLMNEQSSFIPFGRMKTLGLSTLRGVNQKPFDGQHFDVWMTIDSDQVFLPEQVIELVEDCLHKHPCVSGLYKMIDQTHFACVKEWNTDYFKKYGNFKFLRDADIVGAPEYMKVAYNGMGFFACRKEVLYKMKYPYFNYPLQEFTTNDGKKIVEMVSEDVAFCKNIKKAGFDVMVKPSLVVGHLKSLVI